jgi:short-subunit dehydrogenase
MQIIGLGRDFSGWEEIPAGAEFLELELGETDKLPHRLGEIARAHPELDGLVLNAGYGRFGSLEEFSYQQIAEMLDINLLQHIYTTRVFLPRIKSLKRGDLVVIGSEAALSGGKRGAVYAACKFALRGFAQSLRHECSGSGVRVSLINPGMVATDFFQALDFSPGDDPLHHLRPEDVAEAVAMVLSAHPGTVFDEINLSPLQKVIQFRT